MSRIRAPRRERIAVTAVALYEVAALWTPLPTVTYLARRHPWLAGLIVGGLTHHFMPDKAETP